MSPYKKNEEKLHKEVSKNIICSEALGSIQLEGVMETWEQVIAAGQIAAKSDYRGVINHLKLANDKSTEFSKPTIKSKELEGRKVDVLIIGAGIIGSSIARELSRYKLEILVIDKEYDVAIHTSSRNDGMVHPGFAAKSGSLKSKYNILGNAMYDQVAKELNVPLRQTGSYILFDQPVLKPAWLYMKNKSEKLGIKDTAYVSRKELRSRIPHLTEDIKWGYYLPSTKVTSPYKMTVAYAENAVTNGAEFSLNTAALSIEKKDGDITSVNTNKGSIYPKVVINAAGTFADIIADMAGDQFYTIHPRKGEIALLDMKTGKYFDTVVGKPELSIKPRKSKGGGLVKTIEGNILIGPNNYEVEVREDYGTNRETLDLMINKELKLIPELKRSDVITYFAGTRAATYKEDFIIEKSEHVKNFIHVAGIQSPGFASAPAISDKVKNICVDYLKTIISVKENLSFNPFRKAPADLMHMSMFDRAKIIKENPDYGTIVCRCEEISKGEIIDALRSPIPVDTVDGVKRRTRAGMGRCQGGFCLPHVMHIIEEEKGIKATEVHKKNTDGVIVVEETKGDRKYV